MPSSVTNSFELMDDLRPHQDELLHLADLAGIHMDKEIFRSLVQLLNLGVTPDAVFNLLKMMQKKKRTEHVKSRSSSNSQKISSVKH